MQIKVETPRNAEPMSDRAPVALDQRADQSCPLAAHPWWKGAAIYQVYPRSFLDSNGDGIGDLPGITSKLDHIASLGVDGVWLSPFFTSPMNDYGYDVADYCDVDPIFGTLTDFDALLSRAHRLGLKVIVDQVYSHTSDAHPWFQTSRESRDNPKADWYVWANAKPDGSPPNNWQSVFGGAAWTWDSRRGQYYLHNFLTSQPDLNLHNPAVQEALLDVARFWLDRGVDGFRLDAINFAMHDPALTDNPPADLKGRQPTRPFDFQEHRFNQSHADIPLFLERVRGVIDEYTAIFSVAEIGGPDPLGEMKAFTADDQRLHSAYSFDFLYAEDLCPKAAQTSLLAWDNQPGEGWPSWAFSNHDAPRAVSRWALPEDRQSAAHCYALFLCALRGNVFIYQGEELGLPQAHVAFEDLKDPEAIKNWPLTLGRDGARTPIPWRAGERDTSYGFSTGTAWLPTDDAHGPLAVDAQEADPRSTLHQMRTMLAFRRTSPALRLGDIAFIDLQTDDIIAFTRYHDGEHLTCLFNLGATARTLPSFAQAKGQPVLAAGFEGALTACPRELPPYSGIIIQTDP
ncbi:MAG: alpha-amylase family glycosyl hydrolase [Pseudomonadota bacterium]